MILHYHCDKCEYQKTLKYLPREYKLDDDTFITMQQRHFWCANCNDISVIESTEIDLEEEQYLAERLEELKAYTTLSPEKIELLQPHEKFSARRATEFITELERENRNWLRWRSLRKSPGHCLKCGKEEPNVPLSKLQSLTHGECGGTLECKISISSENGPQIYPHLYNIEGKLIEQGKKPKISPGTLTATYSSMELFVEKEK